jgi:hypothetical protein
MSAPLAVACPNCNAQPGEPCTQPDDRGRHPVQSIHFARALALEVTR